VGGWCYRAPMYVANLANGSALTNAAVGTLVLVLTVGTTAIPLTFWWMFRKPKFRGHPVVGSAQVLSLRRIGSMAVNSLVPQIMCRIGLRVDVLGREPYDVKIWNGWAPWAMDAIQPGRTVGVEVDSADPKRIRIGSPSAAGMGSSFTKVATPGEPAGPVRAQMGAGLVRSAAELLASGQRVSGALKSFAPTGTTPRSLGRTPSRPELADAPHYNLVIELHFPNLAPIDARTLQPVPLDQVPNLAIGLALPCAVDPANPQACVVDWDAIAG
jgi:hypothetical protein